MGIWRINGERELIGSQTVQGSKNEVLPVMAASILAPCRTELTNVPALRDVEGTIAILRRLGCEVEREGDVVDIDSSPLSGYEIPHSLMREMRSSVIFLGALLGRCGQARMSMPGGCELGPRPIDLHLFALRSLGAEISEEGGEIVCTSKGLRGANINFPTPSVGATENAMLAACKAEGETLITNAAGEPEIVSLATFLRSMGADIVGDGTPTVRIRGFSPVKAVGRRIMPDRIVASTVLCAAAATGGDVELRGVDPDSFSSVLRTLAETGADITKTRHSVRLRSNGALRAPGAVSTGPYPAFPTDAQPPMLATVLRAEGTSVFVENIFQNRYRFTQELSRFGARVRTEGRVAVVTGVDALHGAPATATDLRGGAALIVAGLAARGRTEILDAGHIIRGYDRFDEKLRSLGADIEYIP